MGRGSARIVDLGDELTDFHETAAVIRNLDVVICCDSAVAHLAGALGTTVGVALSVGADWRWMQNRHDSPWYPSMRLFRQQTLGDWPPVFAEIATALGDMSQQATGRDRNPPGAGRIPFFRSHEFLANMSTHADAIQVALGHHQAGRLNEAAEIYRQVLTANPRHAGAMHLLGLVALQSGRAEAAVTHIRGAIELEGGHAAFHANLGEAYRNLCWTEARSCDSDRCAQSPTGRSPREFGHGFGAIGQA